MLTIRLSRIGKKKKPMYRLVISEKSKDPYGKALEILGSYNPFSKELVVKEDRIKHWISVGSQMSASVNNLLIEKGIIKGDKSKTIRLTKKKRSKLEEAKKEKEAPKEEEKSAETEKKSEESMPQEEKKETK